MQETLIERVGRGAALLDQSKPDWWRKENLDLMRLGMHDCHRCVLGQLYGSYYHGMDSLDEEFGFVNPENNGFDGGPGITNLLDMESYFWQLDNAWRDVVNMRRMAETIKEAQRGERRETD